MNAAFLAVDVPQETDFSNTFDDFGPYNYDLFVLKYTYWKTLYFIDQKTTKSK